jgi:Holliday junction resolvase RusA-like endonuclease
VEEVVDRFGPKVDRKGRLVGRIPMPPTTNHLYPTVQGRRVASHELATWRVAASCATQVWGHERWEGQKRKVRWELWVDVYLPNWLRDVDGTLKAGIDFLAEYFGLDDRYLVELHVRRITEKANESVGMWAWWLRLRE